MYKLKRMSYKSMISASVAISIGLGYEHLRAPKHRPTILSTIYHAIPVLIAASGGLFGWKYNKDIKGDEQRNRLKDVSAEVHNVNSVCAEQDIPLTETLADLFILHHAVNPIKGSSLDLAFEAEIINEFKKELESGLTKSESDMINAMILEKEKKINTFSSIGAGSHHLYSTLKKFAYRLQEGFKLGSPVHRERFDKTYFDTHNEKIEILRKEIRSMLNDTNEECKKNSVNGPYSLNSLDASNKKNSILKSKAPLLISAYEKMNKASTSEIRERLIKTKSSQDSAENSETLETNNNPKNK